MKVGTLALLATLALTVSTVCALTTCDAKFEDVMLYLSKHGKSGEALNDYGPITPLFMIIHVASQGVYRNAHRESWGKLAGVCNVDARNSMKSDGEQANPPSFGSRTGSPCRAYYTFMVGVDGVSETEKAVSQESAKYNDVIVLKNAIDPAPLESGNNTVLKAKVKLAFGYAVHNFQWATHFLKGDIDTYPIFNTVLSHIKNAATVYAPGKIATKHIPADWSEENGGIYMGATMAAVTPPNHDNGFQQGQLYVLSRSLATCMMEWETVRKDSNDKHVIHGECYGGNSPVGEDSMVGCMVETAYVPEYGNFCPAPLYVNWRDVTGRTPLSDYVVHPAGKLSQHETFADWSHFKDATTAVQREMWLRVPGFRDAFDCSVPKPPNQKKAAPTVAPGAKGKCDFDVYAEPGRTLNWCTCLKGGQVVDKGTGAPAKPPQTIQGGWSPLLTHSNQKEKFRAYAYHVNRQNLYRCGQPNRTESNVKGSANTNAFTNDSVLHGRTAVLDDAKAKVHLCDLNTPLANPDSKWNEIKHVHIPKTAGIAVRHDLEACGCKAFSANSYKKDPAFYHTFVGCKFITAETFFTDLYNYDGDGSGGGDGVASTLHFTVLRAPRTHVLSQFLECAFDGWGKAHTDREPLFPHTDVDGMYENFGKWVRWFAESGFSASNGNDFQCYNPVNFQVRAMGAEKQCCSGTNHYGGRCSEKSHHVQTNCESTLEIALANLKLTNVVMVLELYAESWCVLVHKLSGELPTYCRAGVANGCISKGAQAVYHTKIPPHHLSAVTPDVLQMIDLITKEDTKLYRAGVAQVMDSIAVVQAETGVEFLCKEKRIRMEQVIRGGSESNEGSSNNTPTKSVFSSPATPAVLEIQNLAAAIQSGVLSGEALAQVEAALLAAIKGER